jgi:hypothetical protein
VFFEGSLQLGIHIAPRKTWCCSKVETNYEHAGSINSLKRRNPNPHTMPPLCNLKKTNSSNRNSLVAQALLADVYF